MQAPVEKLLPVLLRRPHSIAASKDGTLCIVCLAGLFRLQLSPAGDWIAGQVVHEGFCCVDVCYWKSAQKILALFSRSVARKGPQHRCELVVYDEKRSDWPTKTAELDNGPIGRPRNIVISDRFDWLFLSTKHEQPNAASDSSVFRANASDWLTRNKPLDFKRIISKRPGNIWYMGVAENRRELIVSDMIDGIQHAVDVYDFEGKHLRRISTGHKDEHFSEGNVCWPRGVATDASERFLFVLNEYFCLQSFLFANGQFVDFVQLVPSLVAQDAVAKYRQDAKALLVLDRTLYVVGWKCIYKTEAQSEEKIIGEQPILWLIKMI